MNLLQAGRPHRHGGGQQGGGRRHQKGMEDKILRTVYISSIDLKAGGRS